MQKDYLKNGKRIRRFFGVFIFCVSSSLAGAGVYGGIHSKKKKDNFNNEKYTEVMDKNLFGAPYTYYLPSEPILIMVDDSIPTEYKEEIQRAIDRLNEVSEGLTFKLVPTGSERESSLTIKELNENISKKYEGSNRLPEDSTLVGLAETRRKIFTSEIGKGSGVFINPDYYDFIYPVILHEILHTLGFRDVDHGGTIMTGFITSSTNDLTQDDIDALNYFYPALNKEKEKDTSRSR